MTKMNEAKKRDFVSQIISLLEEEKTNLTENGFDPTNRVNGLREKKTQSDSAEIAQHEAAAKAKEATKHSNLLLKEAYVEASNLADLISGILGKNNELVKRMRKFRN
jgi:hypothetical protein